MQHTLGSKLDRTTEEQEFIVSMQNIEEKLREEGRDEGRRIHARATLRRVLTVRKLAPSRRDEVQIDRCNDLSTLDRWIEQALVAQSVAEALRVNGSAATVRAAPRRGRGKSSS